AGGVTVEAINNAIIGSFTLAGSGAGDGTALAVNVSVNVITNSISAYASNGSNILAGGAISITAADTSYNIGISGAIAIGESGKAFGGAISANAIANQTHAYVDHSTVHSAGSTVLIGASESALVVAVSAGVAASDGTAGSGSFTLNVISNSTQAEVLNGSTVHGGGTVAVAA